MTLPAFVEKARARSEIRNFPARHLEPQLPAHVSRSLRGDGLRPAQGPLLNHRQQKHHLRGDDREPIASERHEALFTPERQPVEPSVSDPAPSAERSKRKPRVLPMLSAGTGPQQGNRSTGQPRAPDRARDPAVATCCPYGKSIIPFVPTQLRIKRNSPKKSPQCIQGFQFRIFTS
jgi:hypothetical protein